MEGATRPRGWVRWGCLAVVALFVVLLVVSELSIRPGGRWKKVPTRDEPPPFVKVDYPIEAEWTLDLHRDGVRESWAEAADRQLEEWRRRKDLEQQSTDRERQIHASAQRAWPASLENSCAERSRRPWVCLRLLDRPPLRLDTPVRYRLEWANLPDRSHLDIVLEFMAPVGSRWRYTAGDASHFLLGTGTFPASGSGSREFEWDGKACPPPSDVIFPCGKPDRGLYRLKVKAAVTVPIAASPGARQAIYGRPVAREEVSAWSATDEFRIDRPIDLIVLNPWSSSGRMPLQGGLGKFMPRPPDGAPLPATRNGFRWCSELSARRPLAGTILVCLPASKIDRYGIRASREDLSYSGDYRVADGLIAPDEAEILAHRLARDLHDDQADSLSAGDLFDYETLIEDQFGAGARADELASMTWLESGVREGVFRDVGKGYWLFEIAENLHWFRSGADSSRELPRMTVVAKVEHDGTACIVAQGEGGYFRPLLQEARYILRTDDARPRTQADIRSTDWDRPCKQRSGFPTHVRDSRR